ncbi:GNAT family N-acetyltransferase [Georgenia alba]|uniref:GNAT family N-acetyltransferase n=1 Tax=Georgenia alba TaxID=2233858 RepID=A0ABW2Q6Y2_9MICO
MLSASGRSPDRSGIASWRANSIARQSGSRLSSTAMDVSIQPERPADHEAVADVVRRAFVEDPRVAGMVSSIRRSPRYRSGLALVARAEGRIAGFVMCSGTDLVSDDGTIREVLTLAPLAVAPEFQGRGIGAALVRAVISEADRDGEPLVVLEGSPSYYGRLGFRFAPDLGIHLDLPERAPREAAQAYPLSNYELQVRGRVAYPPAIAALAG